jgi:hypothetical protein
MGMATPIPLRMTDDHFLRIIRQVAQETVRVKFPIQAKARMAQRGISAGQVYACLRNGSLYEPVHQNVRGDHKCTLRHVCAGDDVKVAVVLKRNGRGEWTAILAAS